MKKRSLTFLFCVGLLSLGAILSFMILDSKKEQELKAVQSFTEFKNSTIQSLNSFNELTLKEVDRLLAQRDEGAFGKRKYSFLGEVSEGGADFSFWRSPVGKLAKKNRLKLARAVVKLSSRNSEGFFFFGDGKKKFTIFYSKKASANINRLIGFPSLYLSQYLSSQNRASTNWKLVTANGSVLASIPYNYAGAKLDMKGLSSNGKGAVSLSGTDYLSKEFKFLNQKVYLLSKHSSSNPIFYILFIWLGIGLLLFGLIQILNFLSINGTTVQYDISPSLKKIEKKETPLAVPNKVSSTSSAEVKIQKNETLNRATKSEDVVIKQVTPIKPLESKPATKELVVTDVSIDSIKTEKSESDLALEYADFLIDNPMLTTKKSKKTVFAQDPLFVEENKEKNLDAAVEESKIVEAPIEQELKALPVADKAKEAVSSKDSSSWMDLAEQLAQDLKQFETYAEEADKPKFEQDVQI